jgi:teichuronic acid biosynthesis glycosyltransferase TuaH
MVVVCAGTSWPEQRMPEHHIARELARSRPVLFVDPPISLIGARRSDEPFVVLRQNLRSAASNVVRLTPLVHPGMRRPGLTRLTEWLTRREIRRALSTLNARAYARIVATDLALFDPSASERRVIYATDDWAAGARLMGRSEGQVSKTEAKLSQMNPHVVAISPLLEEKWRRMGCEVSLIPNGCNPEAFKETDRAPDPPDVRLPRPIAGFAGSLNARVDLELLDAVAERGHSLLLIGPLAEADVDAPTLRRLLRRSNVQWVGAKRFEEMPSYLKVTDVGLTPYVDSAFNRASVPLKTIEYLAAGRAVVATDLPATRSLGTPLVTIATSRQEFQQAVTRLLRERGQPGLAAERQAFAALHSWRARGAEFADLLDRLQPCCQA